MKNCFYVFLVLIILTIGLQAQNNDRLEKLEQICSQQAKQIEALQKRLGVLQDEKSYKDYTQKIVKEYLDQPVAEEEQVGITAGYDNGFFIRGAKGDLELKMTGYVQAGAGIFENNTDDNNTFFLNGVYLAFDAYILKDWHARIEINFADPYSYQFQDGNDYDPELQDAYIEYIGIPEFNVRIGKTHVPFTIEGQYNETEGMSVWSAPFINGWAHGRDVGIMIHGVVANMIGYKIGLFNGEGSSTNMSDDMLFAYQTRIYFLGYDTNPNTFFHVGFLRNRTQNDQPFGLSAPWGLDILSEETSFFETNDYQTGLDIGFKYDKDLKGGHNVRVESEFVYSTWQRHLSTGNLEEIDGYGLLFGVAYRHCLNPEVEGSGVIGMLKFSWTEIDNGDTNDTVVGSNVKGQEAYVYTLGLGYAFNSHVSANINWVMMDLAERANGVNTGKSDESGGLAHAWFFQITTIW